MTWKRRLSFGAALLMGGVAAQAMSPVPAPSGNSLPPIVVPGRPVYVTTRIQPVAQPQPAAQPGLQPMPMPPSEVPGATSTPQGFDPSRPQERARELGEPEGP